MKDNFEIVVAHYNEDLKRLEPYAKNAIIYHKWSDDFKKIKCKKRIVLPNIWRESHTYLYHIVNNYNDLADYTLFFQWWIEDHIETWFVYKSINDYVNEVEKHWFSCSQLFFLIKKNPQINFSWKFEEMIRLWSLKKSQLSFSEFYKALFNKKQPMLLPYFYAANFWVSKDLIKERDKEFYKRALELIPNYSNPIEWHYYERLWFTIFNKKYSFHSINKIIQYHYTLMLQRISKLFNKYFK